MGANAPTTTTTMKRIFAIATRIWVPRSIVELSGVRLRLGIRGGRGGVHVVAHVTGALVRERESELTRDGGERLPRRVHTVRGRDRADEGLGTTGGVHEGAEGLGPARDG